MTSFKTDGGDRRVAVVLVHGIGVSGPLDMMDEISDAMAGKVNSSAAKACLGGGTSVGAAAGGIGYVALEPTEAYKRSANRPSRGLPEDRAQLERHQDDDRGDEKEHLLFVSKGTLGSRPVEIAAAHWSDISFYKEGLLNIIGAMLLTAFGVRFFAKAASDSAPALQFLLTAMVVILAIYAFPVTFVTLVYSIMGLLFEYVLRDKFTEFQPLAIVAGSLLACVTIWRLGRNRAWELRDDRTLALPLFNSILFFAVVFGLLMLGSILIDEILKVPSQVLNVHDALVELMTGSLTRQIIGQQWIERVGTLDDIGILYAFMNWLQIVGAFLLLLLTALSLFSLVLNAILRSGRKGRAVSLILSTVAVISIWILHVVALWPENLATSAAMARFVRSDSSRQTINVVALERSREGIGWRLTATDVPVSLRKLRSAKPGAQPGAVKSDEADRDLSSYYPLLWFDVVFLLFMVVTIAIVVVLMLARAIWKRRNARADPSLFEPHGNEPPQRACWPRLIVTPVYLGLVLGLMTLVSLIGLAQILQVDGPIARRIGLQYPEGPLPREILVEAESVRLFVILYLVAFAFFSHYIRSAMKLVLDIVNHFTPSQKGRATVSEKIAARFYDAVDFLTERDDKPDLVIIAHSQGTIISFDALRDGLMDRIGDRVNSLTFISFGSPFTNVYQHYFSLQYRDLDPTAYRGVRYRPRKDFKAEEERKRMQRLKQLSTDKRFCWINCYRIDDYVGTFIENSIAGFPVNVPIGLGGHTCYWVPEVFEKLFGMQQLRHLAGSAATKDVGAQVLSGA